MRTSIQQDTGQQVDNLIDRITDMPILFPDSVPYSNWLNSSQCTAENRRLLQEFYLGINTLLEGHPLEFTYLEAIYFLQKGNQDILKYLLLQSKPLQQFLETALDSLAPANNAWRQYRASFFTDHYLEQLPYERKIPLQLLCFTTQEEAYAGPFKRLLSAFASNPTLVQTWLDDLIEKDYTYGAQQIFIEQAMKSIQALPPLSKKDYIGAIHGFPDCASLLKQFLTEHPATNETFSTCITTLFLNTPVLREMLDSFADFSTRSPHHQVSGKELAIHTPSHITLNQKSLK